MRVYLYGAGRNLKSFFEQCDYLDYIQILGIVDKDENKWDCVYDKYIISSPKILAENSYDAIIVTPACFDEIKKELVALYDVAENKIVTTKGIVVPATRNLGTIKITGEYEKTYLLQDMVVNYVEPTNDFERFFFENKHRVIGKWLHYFEVYEKYFNAYRNRPIKMLEIGVFKGAHYRCGRIISIQNL